MWSCPHATLAKDAHRAPPLRLRAEQRRVSCCASLVTVQSGRLYCSVDRTVTVVGEGQWFTETGVTVPHYRLKRPYPTLGIVIMSGFIAESDRRRQIFYSHQLQATHRSEAPAWTGRFTPSGHG
jgi:hypothetical protein